jgi:hypothetical protein
MMRRTAISALILVAACAGPPETEGLPVVGAPRWHAVLVTGDPSLAVWGNATVAMAERLRTGIASARFLSARRPDAERATSDAAIAALRPTPGEGCLVFATAHGARNRGLAKVASGDHLPVFGLDRALREGCGAAPPVVILSGCYSGMYAGPPVTRGNRVVLTASRADRTSFGCGAGREFTVYDACLLATITPGRSWRGVATATEDCVSAEERRLRVAPSSEPQASFGRNVAGLLVLP